ncbi:hypothetical protein I5M32_09145 [Pedobacter sp. SD-b]|uniref:Uncharacterized protein n=1 Tax=Pedobacter segetis TaxID=2793069 RepID=A0ABS1BJZ3_9SPHI|nr:hypothetical protein [Pedobacter segetis]MBK0383123.1 hypothetical protein [Pedobacter segetis]
MEAKDKKWESGPMQETDDKRTIEQINRAKEEAQRRNENLDEEEPEGGYKEKNGDHKRQFTDIRNEPKQDKKATHPQTGG